VSQSIKFSNVTPSSSKKLLGKLNVLSHDGSSFRDKVLPCKTHQMHMSFLLEEEKNEREYAPKKKKEQTRQQLP